MSTSTGQSDHRLHSTQRLRHIVFLAARDGHQLLLAGNNIFKRAHAVPVHQVLEPNEPTSIKKEAALDQNRCVNKCPAMIDGLKLQQFIGMPLLSKNALGCNRESSALPVRVRSHNG